MRESEQHMGLAASAAELAMWTWDILRDQVWTTDKGRALFGFAKSDKINFDAFLGAVHPEDREMIRRAAAKAVNGDGEYESEYRVRAARRAGALDRRPWSRRVRRRQASPDARCLARHHRAQAG